MWATQPRSPAPGPATTLPTTLPTPLPDDLRIGPLPILLAATELF
jgi:hypothetical protein